MTRPAQKGFRPAVESLDRRDLMSVSSQWLSGTTWIAQTNSSATAVTVSESGTNYKLTDHSSGQSWTRAKSQVARFELQGGAGADRFVNQTSVPSLMFGNGGDDVLVGGGGADELQGGAGSDRLNGMGGADKLFGQDGVDTLIAVDSTNTDSVIGGAGSDTVWRDSSDALWEVEVTKTVGSFANGADRTLNGDNIADPSAARSYASYRNDLATNNRPLFASGGPSMDDVRQGAVGDCWLLAGAGAIAMDSPGAIKARVVDFDDGTYGVNLGSKFYRVDADLPASGGTPYYAKLGQQNSMWVAVVEKAYAHYRTGANSYASLNQGQGHELNAAFGASTSSKYVTSYANAAALANDLYARWQSGAAVTVLNDGQRTAAGAGAPLVDDHIYTVVRFNKNSAGVITSVVLRNPWGTDGAGSDGANDGYVTVTVAQLYGRKTTVYSGKV